MAAIQIEVFMESVRHGLSRYVPARMEPRRLISASIIGLTLFVMTLSSMIIWHAFQDYRTNQQMIRANSMADHLIRAAASLAVERGTVAGVLGSGNTVEPHTLARLTAHRDDADRAWRQALTVAGSIRAGSGHRSTFSEKVEAATQSRHELLALRAQADHCLHDPPACAITGQQWLAAVTAFIETIGRLREEVFLAVESVHHLVQYNLTMKRWATVASEHAGRERGILAWHVSARQPLSEDIHSELLNARAVVNRTISEMRAFAHRPDVDPRVVQAVQQMESQFLGEYETLRRLVYAHTSTGDYPIDTDTWFAEATRAIDTLLAISENMSLFTGERADRAMQEQARQISAQAALMLLALAFAMIGLTRVRQASNEAFRQKEMAEITLRSIGDAVITTNAEACIEYLNPAAEELTGWTAAKARGRTIGEVFRLLNPVSRVAAPNPLETCLREGRVIGLDGDTVLVRRDGAEFAIENSAAPILDRHGILVGAVMIFYDISPLRPAPHLLSYHALHDSLTGLINRREFERRLAELLLRARQHNQQHALAYLDLDQFKLINDTCGHTVGDRLLAQLTSLLKEQLREGDTLARLGGDEFGLLLEHCSLEQARHIIEALRESVHAFRFSWHEHRFDIGMSIGLVPITPECLSPEELLSEADAACFAAKEQGRNRIQVYEPGNLEMARHHGEMHWVTRLNKALEDNRLRLYCQFIAPLNDDPVLHGEVLLRLEDEQGELLSPLSFLPAAERYNLMPTLDRWVIRTAFAAIARYLEGCDDPSLLLCNINLSGASLCDQGLSGYLDEQFTLHGIPHWTVCFEITESAAIANLERAALFMHAFRKKGCRFALDDFGSGISSFGYLKALPIDYLKIDGQFVRDAADDPVDYAIIKAIHTVGRVMGIQTVAEYVENERILTAIREIGVDYAQGYHVSFPQPIEACLANRS